ncbi:hypothetical protein COI_0208 [Mannheimia haemolytica serotype A2 str. OVINE]|nr:hypothetical protein COI_0208 [Mannheimia haemolytica serotype A2 str. OVINE]
MDSIPSLPSSSRVSFTRVSTPSSATLPAPEIKAILPPFRVLLLWVTL